MMQECPVSIECQLVKTVLLPTNILFFGEIVGAYVDEIVMKDRKPDFPKIDPFFLTMPNNRYSGLGKYIGDAWSAGKNLIQS